MPFPSIQAAAREARATLARFPLSVLSGLTAAGAMIEAIDGHEPHWEPRLIATAGLGLALFTASVTTAERWGIATRTRWMVDGAMLAALGLLFSASLGWTDQMAFLRFAQLLLIAHLLVAVGPYALGRREADRRLAGFWQYNRFLFLRYLIAAFYAAALWVGLSIALFAVDKLFGVHVPGENYARLWAVFAFGFHPWFFLAGVPRDFAALDVLEDYPTGLKVFTQFVLMPLVAVYLVILTAYLGKVVITRTWPSGWIGYLVSAVSAVGVLALLLVHPIRERADSLWVNWYGRWWFVAILPPLVMLLMAVGKRVEQYGITEPRYFLLVLALWMLGLSVYYGVTASRNIKLIPLSLAFVTVLASIGPWDAYAVSRRSQVARLDRILRKNGLGRAGDAGRAPAGGAAVSFEDRSQMSAILRYLHETRGAVTLAAVMGLPVDSVNAWEKIAGPRGNDEIAGRAMRRLGLVYVTRWQQATREEAVWVNVANQRAIDVAGFELARVFSYPGPRQWIGTGADSLELAVPDSSGNLAVKHGGTTILTLPVLATVRASLAGDTVRSAGSLQVDHAILVDGAAQGIRVRLVFESVHGLLKRDGVEVRTGSGFVLAAGFGGRRPDSPRARSDPPKP
jgi:hypothetical protein